MDPLPGPIVGGALTDEPEVSPSAAQTHGTAQGCAVSEDTHKFTPVGPRSRTLRSRRTQLSAAPSAAGRPGSSIAEPVATATGLPPASRSSELATAIRRPAWITLPR